MGVDGQDDRTSHHRVADLAIALSLAADLGTGQPMEHCLRTCWLSVRAAEALDLGDDTVRSVYHVALLRFVGCTSDASETAAAVGGDEIAFNATMAPMLGARPGQATRHFLRHVAEDLPPVRRAGRIVRAMADTDLEHRSLTSHCEVASALARRVGVPDSVSDALAHAYERWDGRGQPDGRSEDAVPIEVRVVSAARDVEIWTRDAGWPAAAQVLAERRGHAHDPAVVDVLLEGGKAWLDQLDDDPCEQVLEMEPRPVLTVRGDDLDVALQAVADVADLKSPWFRQHSAGVAVLARDAARAAGLPDDAAVDVGRAGLVHDIGIVGVPSGVWDRPSALTRDQRERVRLHPYLTERVLRRCTIGRNLAELASSHHERIDRSGYHRHVGGEQLDLGARVLAAADVYAAMGEARPHRPALERTHAIAELLAEVEDGRLGRAEVDAVLEAAGQRTRHVELPRPAGLTEREVDVLRLIAGGHTNRSSAAALGISPKTVGHHVEHIYAKCGVTTRAAATLFAMDHQLLAT